MMVPYFVKGELYEEEEPNLAATAANMFEQWLSDYDVSPEEGQEIEVVYGL